MFGKLCTLFLLLFSCFSLAQLPQLEDYNLVWETQSKNSSESMPCGGGDIGLNVWVENGDVLFYMSRSGTFDENNEFPKLGRVRLRLDPNPFENGTEFSQELRLRQGYVRIKGKKGGLAAQVDVWVDVFEPIVHVEVDSNRPIRTSATYETWRTSDRVLDTKQAMSTSFKSMPDVHRTRYKDEVAFKDQKVLFYHRNKNDVSAFDFAVHQQKMDPVKEKLWNPLKNLTYGGYLQGKNMRPAGTVKGKYADTDFTGFQLKSKTASRRHHIEAVLHIDQTDTFEDWQTGLDKTVSENKKNTNTTRAKSQAWWEQFWERSHIFIGDRIDAYDSKPWQVGRNYQLFRYMLGCNAYGSYPTKFNGGLFTYDPVYVKGEYPFSPDFRLWGGGTFTAQNQRLVYWPMLKSGDFDMMKPQFDFYLRALPNAEIRTDLYWHHQGANFTEQIENYGLPQPFEYNANAYIFNTERPDGFNLGLQFNNWLTYGWDTVFEFCKMILDMERYTGRDISEYLPLIESSLRFFDEHYQKEQLKRSTEALDQEGHLILYPGSAAETYKTTYNSVTTIAGLKAVTDRLLQLPAHYLSNEKKEYFQGLSQRIPPVPFREMDGYKTIAPAVAWDRINNVEAPQMYPVFPYDLYHLGKPGLETALNTFRHDSTVVKHKSYIGWKQDNIFAARLGLASEAADLTSKKLADAPRRFPAFWGPGFDWVPDHNWGGSGMIGLQEMLMQTFGKKIYLFPAWPKAWDVDFKLHAPYHTIVEGTLKNGQIVRLKVTPENREKDVESLLEKK